MSNFGIDFKVTIPESIQNQLILLSTSAGNKIVTAALRSAAAPARKHLRREVRYLRAASDASSGTTFNSIISKVSYPSKKKKGFGYFYVGVDRKYSEDIIPNTP